MNNNKKKTIMNKKIIKKKKKKCFEKVEQGLQFKQATGARTLMHSVALCYTLLHCMAFGAIVPAFHLAMPEGEGGGRDGQEREEGGLGGGGGGGLSVLRKSQHMNDEDVYETYTRRYTGVASSPAYFLSFSTTSFFLIEWH